MVLMKPCTEAVAEDIVQIAPATTFAGATEDDEQYLEVQMVNDTYDEVGIVSFDLLLPEGIHFLYEDFEGERVPFTKKGKNLDYDFTLFEPTPQASGFTRYMLIPGGALRPITGKSGTFMYLYFEVDADMAPGVYPILIQETVIGKSETEGLYPTLSASYIVVKADKASASPIATASTLDLSGMTGYVPSFVVEQLNADMSANDNLALVNLSGATELGAELQTPANVLSVVGTTGSLERTFTSGYWSTVCLPFSLSATQVAALKADGVEIEQFAGFNATARSVNFETAETMEADQPYIVRCSSESSPFKSLTGVTLPADMEAGYTMKGNMTFKGTYEPQTLDSDEEEGGTVYYAFDASNGAFVRIGKNATVLPFRAYMQLTGGSGARLLAVSHNGSDNSEPTAIESAVTTADAAIGPVYTLQGVQAKGTAKGIYIQNGQKIVVR